MAITNVKNTFTTYTLDDVVESKNYHRVLFKPGVAVQARELTEMQTQLQRQIDYQGQYSFNDGAQVIGGEVTLTTDYDYIKVEASYTESNGTTVRTANDFIQSVARTAGAFLENSNGVQAEIIQIISASGVDQAVGGKTGVLDGTSNEPITIYVKYTKGSGNTAANKFVAGEVLTSKDANGNLGGGDYKFMVGGGTDTNLSGGTTTASNITNPIGKGSKVTINEGIYFIAGNFVYVQADSIILSKYSSTPSNIIGLNVTEQVISSADDSSLVDNATGFPNVAAPGASRYKITTQLIKEALATPNANFKNYILLLTIENGIKQVQIPDSANIDAGLTKRLARRTREESGNYSLRPFELDIKEHLDDGTNGGYLTSGNSGNDAKYIVGVEPNIAYVEGFRTENISTKYITVDKPRETSTNPKDIADKNAVNGILDLGNYVVIDTVAHTGSAANNAGTKGIPDTTNFNFLALQKSGDTLKSIALVDNITPTNAANLVPGTYIVTDSGATSSVCSSDTSGTASDQGAGASFKIIVEAQPSGNPIATVLVTSGGSGYQLNNTFTVTSAATNSKGTALGTNLSFDVAQMGRGRARARALTNHATNQMRLYLFDVNVTSGTFADIDYLHQISTITGGGDFEAHLVSTFDGRRFDAEQNSSVYKLPLDNIKTTESDDSPTYQIQKTIYAANAGGSTTFTSTDFFKDATKDTLGSATAIVSYNGGAPQLVGGVGIENTTGDKDLTIPVPSANVSHSIKAIITVQRGGAVSNKKSKTFDTVNNVNYEYDGVNPVFLDKADIYKLVHVKQASSTGPDITDQFELDNGQRANFYEEGRLIPVGNVAAGTITVKFHYYEHTGSGKDFFTIDSYPAESADHKLRDIPTFRNPDGETVDLKDCIDFRPVKTMTGAGGHESNVYSAITDSTFNSTANLTFPAVQPGSVITFDAQIWKGRIDKLVLSKDGNYSVIKGVSAELPVPPDDPNDVMVVAMLEVKPYTYDAKSDVLPTINSYKRYTMKDIGQIDRRVKTLEYYTSLSLLENETLGISIPDTSDSGNTFERFKNGIFVDNFAGHANGQVDHVDYHVSTDRLNGMLRPKYDQKNISLTRKTGETSYADAGLASGKSNITQSGSIFTLPFTQTDHIKQGVATETEFVNPYNVFTWAGSLRLSPESDEWKDTENRPDIVINEEGNFDQLLLGVQESGILGTVWNEWETNWVGVDKEVENFKRGEWKTYRTVRRRRGGSKQQPGWKVGKVVTTTTTTGQSRTGIQTSVVPDQEVVSVDDKLLETNFIPFIRSRKIYFKAEMLKPTTKVYAYFNDVNVTAFCHSGDSYVEWTTLDNEDAVADYAGVTSHTTSPVGSTTSGSGALVTTDAGEITGSFIIPNNDALKFRTGTREFRLTDSATNDRSNETTFAETNYHATGLLEIREKTIVTTKVPKIVTNEVNSNRVVTDIDVVDKTNTQWYDPLAQTFLIDTKGGVFVTSLDLFIQKNGETGIPINVSIRETLNGFPTQKIVPGTDVIKAVGNVTDNAVGSNGTNATNFAFDHPVYLPEGSEFAIVIMSNSDKYKAYVATTGSFDLVSGDRVAKQPYNGVFFKSQNASTWTPDQGRDLKFTLKRAAFTNPSSAANKTLTLVNNVLPPKKLKADPFFICSGSANDSAVLRVTHRNHGMFEGSKVTISGAAAIQTISTTMLNTTHNISDVEMDSYCITIAHADINTLNPTKVFGGGNTVRATENMSIDLLHPVTAQLSFPDTNLSCTAKVHTGKSIDGGQGNPFTFSDNIPLSLNTNNYFDNPIVIAATPEFSAASPTIRGGLSAAGTNIAANKSFQIGLLFSTTNPNLSPVIDASRSSLFCVSNRTNDATNNSTTSAYNKASHGRSYVPDTSARHTSNLNSYITREITLANEASQIDLYANIHKPAGSNVYIYFKAQELGDDRDFQELGWKELTPTVPIPVIDSGFSEIKYTQLLSAIDYTVTTQAISASDDSTADTAITLAASNSLIKVGQKVTGSGIADNTFVSAISGTTLTLSKNQSGTVAASTVLTFTDPDGLPSKFSSFAFKVVLTTNNSARPPMVKDFRAIAST